MYYRRKIILALLQLCDGSLDKISFQKLLFLFTQKQENPSFDFVPYKRGCFSFQSYADFRTMSKYNMIAEVVVRGHESWVVKTDTVRVNYFNELTAKDKAAMLEVTHRYGHLRQDELTKLTYRLFPYYAIHSEVAEKLLSKEELETVRSHVPTNNSPCLFTIGYEGLSLETYLNKLIKHNVKVLCDVRNNPFSMKYGFSKSQLQHACEGLGIRYIHIPQLGIVSKKRKGLKKPDDYTKLFAEYDRTTLQTTQSYQKTILELMKSDRRIALTCFEANPCMCHRSRLAKALNKLPDWKYETAHL